MFSSFRYVVASLYGPLKAVLIATVAHDEHHPDEHVWSVEVRDVGPLNVDSNGVEVFELGDLADVYEW
jgi:hypothetical protein